MRHYVSSISDHRIQKKTTHSDKSHQSDHHSLVKRMEGLNLNESNAIFDSASLDLTEDPLRFDKIDLIAQRRILLTRYDGLTAAKLDQVIANSYNEKITDSRNIINKVSIDLLLNFFCFGDRFDSIRQRITKHFKRAKNMDGADDMEEMDAEEPEDFMVLKYINKLAAPTPSGIKYHEREYRHETEVRCYKNIADAVLTHPEELAELNYVKYISHGDIKFTIWDKRETQAGEDLLSNIEGKYILFEDSLENLDFTGVQSRPLEFRKKLYEESVRQFELLARYCDILHRDIRRENILVNTNGDDISVTLYNFESVDFVSDKVVTRTDSIADLKAKKAAEKRIIENYINWEVKIKMRACFWII